MAGPRLLYSGEKILYKEKYEYAIFSGKIDSFGITVGHIGGGNSIEIHDARDEHVVAEIVARIEGTIKEQDAEYTADISFLKMNSYCIAKNLLRCTDRSTGTTVGEHRLVLHKGSISAGELVMIFDEQGYMKQGKIKSSLFNWKCNETMKEIINALSIVDENNSAIAQHGQSGALVTSLPQSESDVLRVYGIVTHTVEYEDATSVTIANRLWDVLRAHHDNGQHPSLGDTPESIDFAQD